MQQINSTPWKVISSLCTSPLSRKWCLLQTSPPVFFCISLFSWCLFGFIFRSIYLVFEGVNIVIGIVFLAGWFCWLILKSICVWMIVLHFIRRENESNSRKVVSSCYAPPLSKKIMWTPHTSALFLLHLVASVFDFAFWSMYLVFEGV